MNPDDLTAWIDDCGPIVRNLIDALHDDCRATGGDPKDALRVFMCKAELALDRLKWRPGDPVTPTVWHAAALLIGCYAVIATWNER